MFNSYPFVFAFLPITLIGYFCIPKLFKANKTKVANGILLLASLAYYAYYDFSYLWLIIAGIVGNYLLAHVMYRAKARKKLILTFSVVANVALLCFFKYADLLIEAFKNMFDGGFSSIEILFPLGISFLTFQQIAYLVDTYRGEAPEYGFIDYALYIAYFPKLFSGPIAKHDQLIPQFLDDARKTFNFENFAKGIMAFAFGLFQKVILADAFSLLVNYGYSHISTLSSLEAFMAIAGYTFQVYFDFAGYCDMAIGVSLMMNIDLPVNFNSPYRSTNILDFWKRWHITLTNFLTKYIYYPLGGNRKGKLHTYINVLIVFLVSGLWHGAGWTYIIWGAVHGIASVITRMMKHEPKKLTFPFRWLLFFGFVNLSWIPFRAASAKDAVAIIRQVFCGGGYSINWELADSLCQPFLLKALAQLVTVYGAVFFLFLAGAFFAVFAKNTAERLASFKANTSNLIYTIVMLLLGLLSISGVQSFLYVNF